MLKNDLILRAARRQPVPHTPVWIMRQAGRYLPQYRAIRSKVDFLTLCKTPDLVAEVTIQPVDALGVDAAILFSDILIPIEAMGMELELGDKGPHLPNPIRAPQDLGRLHLPDADDELAFVGEAVRRTVRALDGRVPLIGFCGAPFTLAAYMIEGGSTKNFLLTKRFLYEHPKAAHALFELLTQTLCRSLVGQIRAGASLVQIFDSWGGELSPHDFATFSLPYLTRMVAAAQAEGVPVILFATGASTHLETMRGTGADVLGLDWRINADLARTRLGPEVAIQGNLDPCALFLPAEELKPRVQEIISRAGPTGHIFNLGHGILPPTSPDAAKRLVDWVHELSRHG